MSQFRRFVHILLIVLAGVLGLSAVPGGITLLVGFYAPPVEQLKGSVFADFTIPGLTLLLFVGGVTTWVALTIPNDIRAEAILAAATPPGLGADATRAVRERWIASLSPLAGEGSFCQ